MSLSIKSTLCIFLVSWLPFCENNTSEKLLAKRWKFASKDEVRKAAIKNKDGERKNNNEESKELENMLKDIYAKSSYEFRKDKQYIITKPNNVDKGTWELSSDERRILITNSKGASTILYIKALTEAKLTLTSTSDSSGKTLTLIPF